jgi:hypothetical protein
LIPRLQRFYGGNPAKWLELPGWLFWVYARMMPVIHARESIHRINEMIYAAGNMKEESGRAFIGDLQRIAARAYEGSSAVAERPRSMEDMQRMLSLSGSNTGIG